jgi:hypothetical protein
MAKLILFLLTLALVSASSSKIRGAAAAAEDDLQQRGETLAEVFRVFSNPASAAAADSATIHRSAAFLKREMGPLVPIFKAIHGMPKSTAAEVRAWEEAFDAAQELLVRHFDQLLAPHGGSAKTTGDGDLPQRKAAAAEPEMIRQATMMMQCEIGPFEIVFYARSKTEAGDAAE